MKKWRIKDFSYFADVWLIVGTEDEIAQWTKRTFPSDGEQRGFTGRHIQADTTEHYILLPVEKERPSLWQISALAHEVMHLTFAVLGNAGITYTSECEEAYTYYMQAMFVQMLEKIDK